MKRRKETEEKPPTPAQCYACREFMRMWYKAELENASIFVGVMQKMTDSMEAKLCRISDDISVHLSEMSESLRRIEKIMKEPVVMSDEERLDIDDMIKKWRPKQVR